MMFRPLKSERVFFNQPLLLVEDVRYTTKESRFHALGVIDTARRLHITLTLHVEGSLIRVISARDISLR